MHAMTSPRPQGAEPQELPEIDRSTSSSLLQQRSSTINTDVTTTTTAASTTTTTTTNNNNNNNDDSYNYYTTTTMGDSSQPPDSPESLMEKLRDHYKRGSPKGSKAKVFARVFFQFHALTFVVMMLVYLTPFALQDYGQTAVLWFRVLVCYVFVLTQLNWCFAIFYDSDLPDTSRLVPRPPAGLVDVISEDSTTTTTTTTPFTATTTTNVSPLPRVDHNGLVWKYCDICQTFRPPRTYHCKFCRKCVLRRDHHCHLIGKCIGHYNQRYFVVLCFYCMVSSAVGFPMTCSYLANLPDASSWTSHFLPYTLLLFLTRYVSWQFLLLTFHAYVLFIFGIVSMFYWLGQLSIISMGKTLVEVIKQIDVKATSSLSENFAVVFGDHWFLSFLFPVQGVFRQTHDGIHFNKVKIYGKKEEDS